MDTPASGGRVSVGTMTSRINTFDGNAATAPETVRALAAAVLPLVREMLEHEQRVRKEGSLHNGYVDRIERGSA